LVDVEEGLSWVSPQTLEILWGWWMPTPPSRWYGKLARVLRLCFEIVLEERNGRPGAFLIKGRKRPAAQQKRLPTT
jgi:hypothetical protein